MFTGLAQATEMEESEKLRRGHILIGVAFTAAIVFASAALSPLRAELPGSIVVDVGANAIENVFDPLRTIGAGVDSQNDGAVATLYAPPDVDAMLSSGLGPVSYRLYTELSVQHWHWNPAGAFSARDGGYWRSSDAPGRAIRDSYGYRLPHRGFTHDQGNDDDYSRLDDGDRYTYWKSDPYLTSRYTGDPDDLHPQWVVVDLGRRTAIDAIRISWADPYARSYVVQFWNGHDAMNDPGNGRWIAFDAGAVSSGRGGDVVLRLARRPIGVEFVRVLMRRSSNTCDSHGTSDVRNCVGYAIAELGIGTVDDRGGFRDVVRHRPGTSQTVTYASSVDPWHAPSNRVTDQEQPGLDTVFRSGITRGLPAMLPVGMLYGTPEDAAAEMRYVERRGYPVSYVELGEEPDGQYVTPEDGAALYVQWSRALHAVDPRLRLGGPVFQGVTSDVQAWPDEHGDVSWLKRFLGYLRAHGAVQSLNFMSFEHYPFDACNGDVQHNLLSESDLIRSVVHTWRADGVPTTTPLMITEANYAAGFTPVPQEIAGALWYADFVGSFLATGGAGAYLYEYEPIGLQRSGCDTWGNLNLWNADGSYHVRQRAAQFFAANLLTRTWAQPIDAPQRLFASNARVVSPLGTPLGSYALLRPDRTWSLLIINNDLSRSYDARVAFVEPGRGRTGAFDGAVEATTFDTQQYDWHPHGPNGFARPDGPARTSHVPGGVGRVYVFPAASLTVLRGRVRLP